MSTNDLTARARARAAHWPMTETSALLSELADEVDQLRASLAEAVTARNYACRQRDEEARAKVGNIDALNKAVVERDAAQAVVDRVTDLVLNTPHAWVTVRELTHILRGQP